MTMMIISGTEECWYYLSCSNTEGTKLSTFNISLLLDLRKLRLGLSSFSGLFSTKKFIDFVNTYNLGCCENLY